MAKISLSTLLGGFASVARLNTNFDLIESDLNNRVLYRDNPPGQPNSMGQELDMSGHDIVNLPVPTQGTHPVRLQDVESALYSHLGMIPIVEPRQIAGASQTIFTVTATWINIPQIYFVNVDGVSQKPGVDFDVTATPGQIEFDEALPTGAVVDIITFIPNVVIPPGALI